MGLGVSLFLIAIGAILTFAVNAATDIANIDVIGWILMAIGLAGLLLSLLFWSSWGGPAAWGNRRRTTTYVEDGPGPY